MATKNPKPGKKNTKHTPAPEEKIENALDKTEMFFQKNAKVLLIALAVAVVLVGGFFGVKHLYIEPRAEKAAANMFVAEQLFAQENYLAALEGDGNNAGFLEIVDTYGSSKPGRLAAHYAGICYMKQGDMVLALEYLGKYKKAKGVNAMIVNAQNLGLQGDCYVQLADYGKAIEFYGKAVSQSANTLTAPYYMKKLGLAYEQSGNTASARSEYERLISNYPGTPEAMDAERYLGAIEQK